MEGKLLDAGLYGLLELVEDVVFTVDLKHFTILIKPKVDFVVVLILDTLQKQFSIFGLIQKVILIVLKLNQPRGVKVLEDSLWIDQVLFVRAVTNYHHSVLILQPSP